MTGRELRLRQRIDTLSDERDYWKRKTLELAVLAQRLTGAHMNQWGLCPTTYDTEEQRQEARRRSWRESKRRAAEKKRSLKVTA